jgi:hypothetical protein
MPAFFGGGSAARCPWLVLGRLGARARAIGPIPWAKSQETAAPSDWAVWADARTRAGGCARRRAQAHVPDKDQLVKGAPCP